MKISVDRDVLTEAVTWTARALAPRPATPVLSGILITAANNTLTFEAFDYTTSAHLDVDASIETEGSVLVSGKMLADIARTLPAAPVTLELENSKLTVSCGRSRFHLATMPVDEYPTLPQMPEVLGTVDGSEFARAVSQVSVAAARDETLPILTGIKVELEDDTMTLLPTDRYRLAMRELNWKPAASSVSSSALVKSKTLSDVAKTLGSAGELSICMEENGDIIGFVSGSRRTTTLLVDGDYPKIRSLFPEESLIYASVSTSELIEAVRRVSIVAERNSPVRLQFSDAQVSLDAGSGEEAQAEEAIESQLNGEDITVAFNPPFLSEGLSAFDTDNVQFAFTTAPKPAMLTALDQESGQPDMSFRYLVMPVRLPNA